MSSNDLEGDDIWGDSGGSGGGDDSNSNDNKGSSTSDAGTSTNMDAEESKQADESSPPAAEEPEDLEDDETRHMSIGELRQRIHLLNNDIRIMKSDVQRITHESRGQRDAIRENQEKIKMNKQLPYLVANVVEVLEPDAEDGTCVRCD